MSLDDGVQKDILEEEYEEYREIAERAREQGKVEKAVQYYRECASVLRDIADLESSKTLATERRNLADNLETAATTLEKRGHLKSEEEQSGDDSGAAGGEGDAGRMGSPETDEDAEDADPTEFLEEPPDIDFDDVGGMTELKETLKDKVVDPLERRELYDKYDLGVVNGVLLYGPPGTGKTYITRALAGKLDYNFIDITPSEITSSLVGESAENVANLFEVARNNQPCLVFLDEIDALVPSRSGGAQKTQSERQMVNQFLTELTENRGEDVIVVAATNIPDEVDGAARSRFQERIEVPPPDATAREAILRVHLRDRPVLTEEINWERIRKATDGYSARDLEIIAANAARKALQETRDTDDLKRISQRHLEEAIQETDSSLENWTGAA